MNLQRLFHLSAGEWSLLLEASLLNFFYTHSLAWFKDSSLGRVGKRNARPEERRFQEDRTFRRGLIQDPKTTLEHMLGESLPENLALRVIEESGEHFYLVVPANPYPELSDAELQAVFGMNTAEIAHWVWDAAVTVVFESGNLLYLVLPEIHAPSLYGWPLLLDADSASHQIASIGAPARRRYSRW